MEPFVKALCHTKNVEYIRELNFTPTNIGLTDFKWYVRLAIPTGQPAPKYAHYSKSGISECLIDAIEDAINFVKEPWGQRAEEAW